MVRILLLLALWSLTEGCATRLGTDPLARSYTEDETARYTMTGTNAGREHVIRYEAEAETVVRRDEAGRFYEEVRWTRLSMSGRDMPLDDASRAFRQRVSLDKDYEMVPPDISGINPMLIGPVFDFMTFYVDLHPSLHQGRLRRAGDRVYVPHGQPNSWADGVNVLIGEDSIDFDLTLDEVSEQAAALHVRHVPPKEPTVQLPASWMHEPVTPGAPNNWVQVQRAGEEWLAAVGHEVFDVRIEIERPGGRIVVATMDNPVDVVQRRCADAALTSASEPAQFRIHRRVELRRVGVRH